MCVCSIHTLYYSVCFTFTFLCFPRLCVRANVCIFIYAMPEKWQLDAIQYSFYLLLGEVVFKMVPFPILIMCYILLFFIHYMIVWQYIRTHTYTNMPSSIYCAFAFASHCFYSYFHSLLKSLPLYMCCVLLHIACTFCSLLFISYFIHSHTNNHIYVISFKQFSSTNSVW